MSAGTIEKVITNAIHTAFIKYPEGDGDPNLDYDWIPPEQSSHITKAILLDLDANGFQIVKKAEWQPSRWSGNFSAAVAKPACWTEPTTLQARLY
jgi:hypothetical protein